MPTKDDCRAHRLQAQWAEVDHNADRLAIGVAILARAAAAPETPSEGKVLSPNVLSQAQCRVMMMPFIWSCRNKQKLYMHACVWMVMDVMDRMTRTASLSASHSSPGLPPHHRQRARC